PQHRGVEVAVGFFGMIAAIATLGLGWQPGGGAAHEATNDFEVHRASHSRASSTADADPEEPLALSLGIERAQGPAPGAGLLGLEASLARAARANGDGGSTRLAERLRLLRADDTLRTECIFLPTPVGSVEVTLLTA